MCYLENGLPPPGACLGPGKGVRHPAVPGLQGVLRVREHALLAGRSEPTHASHAVHVDPVLPRDVVARQNAPGHATHPN